MPVAANFSTVPADMIRLAGVTDSNGCVATVSVTGIETALASADVTVTVPL